MKNKKIKFDVDMTKSEFLESMESEDFAYAKLYVCRDGNNHHEMPITFEAIKLAMKTLPFKPLIAEFEMNGISADFGTHGKQNPIGYFTEDVSIEEDDEGQNWIVATAKIWKKYSSVAMDIFKDREGFSNVSMEISVYGETDSEGNEIELFSFDGVTILGAKYTPAIKDANILITSFSVDYKNNENKKILERLNITKEVYKNIKFALNLGDENNNSSNLNNIEKNNKKEEFVKDMKKNYMKSFIETYMKEFMNPNKGTEESYMKDFMVENMAQYAEEDTEKETYVIIDEKLLKYMDNFAVEYAKEGVSEKEDVVEYMKEFMKEYADDEVDNVYMCEMGCAYEDKQETFANENGEDYKGIISELDNNEDDTLYGWENVKISTSKRTIDGKVVSVYKTIEKNIDVHFYSVVEIDVLIEESKVKFEAIKKENEENKVKFETANKASEDLKLSFEKKEKELKILQDKQSEFQKKEYATMVEVILQEEVFNILPIEKIEELREQSLNFSFDTIENFAMVVKAIGFDAVKKNQQKNGNKGREVYGMGTEEHNIKRGDIFDTFIADNNINATKK